MIKFMIVLAAIASIVGISTVISAIVKKPSLPQLTDEEAICSDWEAVDNDMWAAKALIDARLKNQRHVTHQSEKHIIWTRR